jgi:hypothetical protein
MERTKMNAMERFTGAHASCMTNNLLNDPLCRKYRFATILHILHTYLLACEKTPDTLVRWVQGSQNHWRIGTPEGSYPKLERAFDFFPTIGQIVDSLAILDIVCSLQH